MKLHEVSIKTHSYVGNCVNSFDEDGENCTRGLPYRDTSDFAVNEENYIEETKDEFLKHTNVNPSLKAILNSHHTTFYYDQNKDVHIMYDQNKDVHYFYTKDKFRISQ